MMACSWSLIDMQEPLQEQDRGTERIDGIQKHNLGRLQISRVCNQRCVFCSAPPVGGELPFEEIAKRMTRLKHEGTTDLMLTGGEPTLKKDLFDILTLATQLGFEEITIQSNGAMLYREDFVRRLSTIKNLKFNVSFHTSDRKTFGELSQAPWTYDNTLKGLANLGKYGIPVFLTIVIQKGNYALLKSHIEFCRQHFPHITHFSFNFIDPIYNARENPWTIPTFTEAEPHITDALQHILDEGCTFRIEKIPLCFLSGFEHFHSDLRRDIFNETRLNSFFRVKTDHTPKDWYKETRNRFFYAPQCGGCSLKEICPGINENYVAIHGHGEARPVKGGNPPEILAKALATKTRLADPLQTDAINGLHYADSHSSLFRSRVHRDLELFRHAISVKPNKNNVYDTYSHFLMQNIGLKDEGFIKKAWQRHVDGIRSGKNQKRLSFYIHMPYCKTNCTFCVYPSTTMTSDQQVEDYVQFLITKMEEYAPLFSGVPFDTFYMGGGTPSVLSAEQLDRLFTTLFSLFEFEKDGERAIEFNPSTTTMEKLKVLEKHHFNKFSIGVQSLSPRVLKINKRMYQTRKMVEEAISNFKKVDLNYINVDLLLGLKGDTPQEFLSSFEDICQMAPNNICIYPVKTNDKYISENYHNFAEFEEFYYPLFGAVTSQLIATAGKNGFLPSPDTDMKSYVKPMIFVRNHQKGKTLDYTYSHFSIEEASIFCLGFYSHARIANLMDYRHVDRNARNSMFLKHFSSHPPEYAYDVDLISPRFERVKFIVQNFYKHRSLSRAAYRQRYGQDIATDFPYAVRALETLGVLSPTPERIDFGQKDEKFYYPYLLFFVGRENVLRKTGPLPETSRDDFPNVNKAKNSPLFITLDAA